MNHFDVRLLFERRTRSLHGISVPDLIGFLSPKCAQVLPPEGLKDALSRGEPLRIKFGIDPTARDIHIGHAVPIMLLSLFQRAGHHVDLIIGSFTARVGDPTDRVGARGALSSQDIAENMRTYKEQVGRYIDISAISFHENAAWLDTMPLQEAFGIFQGINLSTAMQRDDFRSRYAAGHGVSLAEACYGVLMGLDSVHLRSEIEIGGIDQLLNFQQCREAMRAKGMAPETALMTPILIGTSGDGRKMSKSLGNYIPVMTTPDDKFGKFMSIPDGQILPYALAFADIHADETEGLRAWIADHPLEAKKRLGTLFVACEEGRLEAGEAARETFERRFSQRTITDEDCVALPAGTANLSDALFAAGSFASRSELRRLFEQNAVRWLNPDGSDGQVAKPDDALRAGSRLRVGKQKRFRCP